MKFVLLSFLVAAGLSQPLDDLQDGLHQWEMFKITYNKQYKSDVDEEERQNIFLNNLQFIREHNSKYERGEVSFNVEVNKFADMTSLEFRKQMNGYRRSSGPIGSAIVLDEEEDMDLPRSVDWRKKGAVTPIKDQGGCGSCWAFSASGSIEGQNFLKTKKLTSLSEQNLVDCSRKEGNEGCNGGEMEYAFNYVKDNNGIDTEASYPYEGEDNKCRYKKGNRGATATGYVNTTCGSENDLKKAVATVGPISVGIDASQDTFQFYKHGVYKDRHCSTTDLDHGVLAIGYGTMKKGGDYWLVKNSWGTGWGMKGYITMARNDKNMCGIATEANYPLM